MQSPELVLRSGIVSYDQLHDKLVALQFGLEPDDGRTVYDSPERRIPPRESWQVAKFVRGWLPSVMDTGTAIKTTRRPGRTIQVVGNPRAVKHTIPEGNVIEVAGPTYSKESLGSLYGLRPTYVTNIVAEPDKPGYVGPVDFAADATELPFENNSQSAIYASCLPGALRGRSGIPEFTNLRDNAISEASRVIKPGGYLLWCGGTEADFTHATDLGLRPVYIATEITHKTPLCRSTAPVPGLRLNMALQKPVI